MTNIAMVIFGVGIPLVLCMSIIGYEVSKIGLRVEVIKRGLSITSQDLNRISGTLARISQQLDQYLERRP